MITIWRLETDENDKPGVPENLKVTFTGPSSLIPFLNTADIQEDVMDLHDGTAYHFLYHRASLPVWSVYIVKYVRTSSSWRTADLIPDDIAAVGYDGIPLSQMMHPKLTTYRQDTVTLGKVAAAKLIELIEHPKTTIMDRVVVSGELVRGGSVAVRQ